MKDITIVEPSITIQSTMKQENIEQMKKLAESMIQEVNGMKYKCTVCGYIYDDEKESVKFEDLPDDWTCPLCGVSKDLFEKVEE